MLVINSKTLLVEKVLKQCKNSISWPLIIGVLTMLESRSCYCGAGLNENVMLNLGIYQLVLCHSYLILNNVMDIS